MAFYKSRRTFSEFKDSVITNFENRVYNSKDRVWWISGYKVSLNFVTWSNSKLYPENSAIFDHSDVIARLRYARERDTLHRIHNYSRPLAFTVVVDLEGSVCRFRCYDLSTITVQAFAKDLIEAADDNLLQASDYHALTIPGSRSSNLIPNTDPKVLAQLKLMLSNLGEAVYNIPIWDDGRFTYEVLYSHSKEWFPADWPREKEKMWQIFIKSAGQQRSGSQQIRQLPPGEL